LPSCFLEEYRLLHESTRRYDGRSSEGSAHVTMQTLFLSIFSRSR
jgi:hypothetical protein